MYANAFTFFGVGLRVDFWVRQRISYVARFGKNALTGDGCCWHTQHSLRHRTKNRITGLMLCPPTQCGLSVAVPCTNQLQLHRVIRSRRHVGRSRSTSRVEVCPNWRLWRCRLIMWRSDGGIVSLHRRSRLLMFAHDTYSSTNCFLTPFVGVDSNAISLNLRSTTVATQVRSRDR